MKKKSAELEFKTRIIVVVLIIIAILLAWAPWIDGQESRVAYVVCTHDSISPEDAARIATESSNQIEIRWLPFVRVVYSTVAASDIPILVTFAKISFCNLG